MYPTCVQHKLELTGPSRATTADDGFDIVVYIPATRKNDDEVCKLSCGTDNTRLHNKLKTRTIKTERGRLYVTCSVLPDALEGCVSVLLQVPGHWRGAAVYGLITARFGKLDVGSTLFSKDLKAAAAVAALEEEDDGGACSEEGYCCVRVPLTRSVLAVPLGEYIHIEGELQVTGYDAMPINVDHRVAVDRERLSTPWIKSGESSSAVRLSLGCIF